MLEASLTLIPYPKENPQSQERLLHSGISQTGFQEVEEEPEIKFKMLDWKQNSKQEPVRMIRGPSCLWSLVNQDKSIHKEHNESATSERQSTAKMPTALSVEEMDTELILQMTVVTAQMQSHPRVTKTWIGSTKQLLIFITYKRQPVLNWKLLRFQQLSYWCQALLLRLDKLTMTSVPLLVLHLIESRFHPATTPRPILTLWDLKVHLRFMIMQPVKVSNMFKIWMKLTKELMPDSKMNALRLRRPENLKESNSDGRSTKKTLLLLTSLNWRERTTSRT